MRCSRLSEASLFRGSHATHWTLLASWPQDNRGSNGVTVRHGLDPRRRRGEVRKGANAPQRNNGKTRQGEVTQLAVGSASRRVRGSTGMPVDMYSSRCARRVAKVLVCSILTTARERSMSSCGDPKSHLGAADTMRRAGPRDASVRASLLPTPRFHSPSQSVSLPVARLPRP